MVAATGILHGLLFLTSAICFSISRSIASSCSCSSANFACSVRSAVSSCCWRSRLRSASLARVFALAFERALQTVVRLCERHSLLRVGRFVDRGQQVFQFVFIARRVLRVLDRGLQLRDLFAQSVHARLLPRQRRGVFVDSMRQNALLAPAGRHLDDSISLLAELGGFSLL